MKSSKFTGKIKKIKAKWTQVSLKNVLKVKDPKLSRVLIVQNNLYASDKFAKRATYEFSWALFLLLVGSGPKKSMAIGKLGSSSLVSHIFQREGKLHRSLTGRKLWSQAKKKCSRHLIYARACVNKDFVHSGSLRLIYGQQAHYVINVCGLIYFLVLTTYANAARGSKNDLPRLEYNLNCNWGIFKQYNALSIGLRA